MQLIKVKVGCTDGTVFTIDVSSANLVSTDWREATKIAWRNIPCGYSIKSTEFIYKEKRC